MERARRFQLTGQERLSLRMMELVPVGCNCAFHSHVEQSDILGHLCHVQVIAHAPSGTYEDP